VVGDEMRRMVDEPDQRAEIDARLQDVWQAMGVTTNPIPVKAALNMLGHRVGGLRLPLVEADEDEQAAVRRCSSATDCCRPPERRRGERQPAGPAPRWAG
jgi:dihydrodipicolinate synthase/N-acetylneuraminate lyase